MTTGPGRTRNPLWSVGRALRRTPAVWLALPFGAMALILLHSTPDSGYGLARASAAHATLVVVGAFAAVCAAWETETLRRLWGRLVVTRPWWQVLAARLAPTLGITAVLLAVVYAVALLAPPGPVTSGPGWQFPVLTLLAVTAWTLFGAAVTLSAGRLVALPAALLVPYLATTLPAGWEPLWLRHTTGILFDCCATGQVLDPRAVGASTAVLGALGALSLCVAAVRLGPAGVTPWPAVVVAVAVLATAAFPVANVMAMGASPTAPRSASDLVCSDRVCLWPEDEESRPANREAWDSVSAGWSRLGLPPLPDTVSAATGHGMPVATTFVDARQARLSMAASVPRVARGCTDDYDDERLNRAFDDLSYLLLVELGMREDLDATGLSVSTPAPRAEQAPRLWQATEQCP